MKEGAAYQCIELSINIEMTSYGGVTHCLLPDYVKQPADDISHTW